MKRIRTLFFFLVYSGLLVFAAVAGKAVAAEYVEMQTGFFESLELGPDVLAGTGKKPVAAKQKKEKKHKQSKKQDTKSGSTVLRSGDKTAGQGTTGTDAAKTDADMEAGQTEVEQMSIWHYLLLALIALVFLGILFVLVRLGRNAKIVESPDNLIRQMKELGKEFDVQNKHIKEVKLRIQKTENSFLKVLSGHMDEKVRQLVKEMDMQFQDFAGTNKALLQKTAEVSAKVSEIEGLLSSLKEFVAEQKAELRKMREGYDWSVVNSMCVGLIGVIDKLDEDIRALGKGKEKERLREARALLLVLLETYDVKEQSPKVGSAFVENEANEEKYKVTMVKSDQKNMKGKVARVIKPSFVYESGNKQQKVLRVAEIEVYQ